MASEVAEKLKLQLKKLELIRMLSDKLVKKGRLGVDVYMRGMSGGIRLKSKSKYTLSLYELLKAYSVYVMRKNFSSINIPKLPLFTTEQAIDTIKKNLNKFDDWSNVYKIIPKNFKVSKKLKKSGLAGLFSASLELSKEGLLTIMQEKKFDKLLVKQKNE